MTVLPIPQRRVAATVLACGAIGLALIPFVSTFSELLTNAAMALGLDAFLGTWIAPLEGRLAHGILALMGLRSSPDGALLSVADGGGATTVYIAWNCVGWQTLLFLAVSMVPGLQGAYTRSSRLTAVAVGLGGLLALNVARIAAVAVVALYFGPLAALIVHDYGTLMLAVTYLMWFWAYAFRSVLVPR